LALDVLGIAAFERFLYRVVVELEGRGIGSVETGHGSFPAARLSGTISELKQTHDNSLRTIAARVLAFELPMAFNCPAPDTGTNVDCVLKSAGGPIGVGPLGQERVMATNPRNIGINDLLLDTHNPRVEPVSAQREEMQKLLDDQKENIAFLAEDIVANGISPIDVALVTPSKIEADKFIVLEGNRRVLALKILANPRVLGDLTVLPGVRKRLEAVAEALKEKPVRSILCSEVPSRKDGQHWIQLRHTGENKGAGVVGWTGVASSRFLGEDPALQAIEFLLKSGCLSKEEQEMVGSMRFPITTLRRLLESRDVRKLLGIEIKDSKLLSGLPPDELLKPLKRVALDLARGDITVTDLKRKDQQVTYVEKFPAADRADLRKVGSTRPVQDISADEFSKKGDAGDRKKRNVSPDRKALVPKATKIAIGESKINEIYHELRQLKVDDTAHACAVLLRVFLELCTDHYCEANGIALHIEKDGRKKDKPLARRVEEAIDHMIGVGAKKGQFQALRRGIHNDNSPLSAALLNAYVHNRFTKPSPRELRNAWDHAEPFCQHVWRPAAE